VAMIATTQGTRVLVMTTTSYTALYAASCANSTPEHAPPPGAPGAVNGAVHRGPDHLCNRFYGRVPTLQCLIPSRNPTRGTLCIPFR
jgi:hypothetical protein